MTDSVHYKRGNEKKIAFVFSCPGRLERDSNPPGPAKGETGNNLECLIHFLSQQIKTAGVCRDKVTITNSWPNVEFNSQGGTGRSEATISEVLTNDNIDRLLNELVEIRQYIFVCGINAKKALIKLKKENSLQDNVRVFDLPHLGNQSLNQIMIDKDGERIISYSKASQKPSTETRSLKAIRQDNKRRRIEKVAYDFYQNIENENSL
jgi:hypothetical protein